MVHPESEADVAVRLPGNIEFVGRVERFLVTIGRSLNEIDGITGSEQMTSNVNVSADPPHHHLGWPVIPQEFFDRRLVQAGRSAQQLPLVGRREKRSDSIGQ